MIDSRITPSQFQTLIFTWWKTHRRDLPWRKTDDPYRILVSEVMLQQTQVNRVLSKYLEFLDRFPDIQSLAAAKLSDVIVVWKGLGYNRRAKYLWETAKIIVQSHRCILPRNEAVLRNLPGLGTYTVRALLVFAYKMDTVMIDTNIRKIITHYFFGGKPQKESIIEKMAASLLPKGKSWEWHQALMDYGALEMPKITIRIMPTKPSSSQTMPFIRSTRFVRGKIIDALRIMAAKEDVLVKDLCSMTAKPEAEVRRIIDVLITEGIIKRRSHGIISLRD